MGGRGGGRGLICFPPTPHCNKCFGDKPNYNLFLLLQLKTVQLFLHLKIVSKSLKIRIPLTRTHSFLREKNFAEFMKI